MKKKLLIILLLLNVYISCTISSQDAKKIGMLIWQNEASKKLDLLVFWNPYEPFPSLGIGHFIWPVNESNSTFAKLCNYLQKHKVILPDWVVKAKDIGCPWKSRQEFLNDKQSIKDLLDLLSSTIDLQINFMMEQLYQLWPLILQAAPENQRNKFVHIFDLMQSTLLGNYALVDYLNFKGSGLGKQNWGLLQVLLDMPDNLTLDNVNKAFAVSAAQTLLTRIRNSAPNYSIIRFFHGWMKRISTYADPDILNS